MLQPPPQPEQRGVGFLLGRFRLVVASFAWVVIAIAFLSGLVDSDGPADQWMIGTGVAMVVVGYGITALFVDLLPRFVVIPLSIVGIAGGMLALGAVIASNYGAGWVLAGGAAMVLLGMLRLPGSRSADW